MSEDPKASAAADATLLQRRAEALARPLAARVEEGAPAVVVSASDSRFAVRLGLLSGIVRLGELVHLPGAPAWVAGLAVVRGRVRWVVDLGAALGLPSGQGPLALLVEQPTGVVAFRVDEIETVRAIDAGELVPAPAQLRPATSQFIAGVTADGVAFLDLGVLAASLTSSNRSPAHD